MADEKHQMPALMVVGPAFAPRRHARKTHAILYDVIQLAIGELLSFRQAHVRSPGIQFSAHLRPAAAGIAVTACAMLGKVSASLDKKLRARAHRILQLASLLRNGEPPGPACQRNLQRARLRPRTQSSAFQPDGHGREEKHWTECAADRKSTR